jgi:hypothetical protein
MERGQDRERFKNSIFLQRKKKKSVERGSAKTARYPAHPFFDPRHKLSPFMN